MSSPLQPRRHFDSERLQELAQAIRSQGMIEPLVVRPAPAGDGITARYELIAGERRWRAARAAGLSVVPVVVRELDDHAALEMSLVENLMREDLNAVEEARGFDRLVRSFAMSHEQVAARIGKSRPYVTNAMRLLDLPPSVLEMIEGGKLSAGQARPLLTMASAEAQTVAARRIVEGRISARGAEELAGAARRARRIDASRERHRSEFRSQFVVGRRGDATRTQTQGPSRTRARPQTRPNRDRVLRARRPDGACDGAWRSRARLYRLAHLTRRDFAAAIVMERPPFRLQSGSALIRSRF